MPSRTGLHTYRSVDVRDRPDRGRCRSTAHGREHRFHKPAESSLWKDKLHVAKGSSLVRWRTCTSGHLRSFAKVSFRQVRFGNLVPGRTTMEQGKDRRSEGARRSTRIRSTTAAATRQWRARSSPNRGPATAVRSRSIGVIAPPLATLFLVPA